MHVVQDPHEPSLKEGKDKLPCKEDNPHCKAVKWVSDLPDVIEDPDKVLVLLAPHLGQQHLRQLAALPGRRLECEAPVQEGVLWHSCCPALDDRRQPAQSQHSSCHSQWQVPIFEINRSTVCNCTNRSSCMQAHHQFQTLETSCCKPAHRYISKKPVLKQKACRPEFNR